ncbi:alpha/beta fold hydrolase [Arthrobacter sp. D3-16]
MSHREESPQRVASQGAELAVFEYGPDPGPDVPTLLLVHGYPDDHRVYLPLIDQLSASHRIIAYDTRNAGLSSVREQPGNFSLPRLVDDLYAVLSATQASPVHLVGHDWGSIQAWAAIQDPRAPGRITRFTSISGPDLRHLNWWIRQKRRNPQGWAQLMGQLVRSSYVGAFQVPRLPEAAWHLIFTRYYEKARKRPVGDNPVRGLALYRQNLPYKEEKPAVPVSIPVHVVVPDKDPFLSPHLLEGLESRARQLTITHVNAGHWWPETHASDFAALLRTGPSASL